MATDLQVRKSAAKPDAYLRRTFAELCARIKRVDLITHLLALVLATFTYALVIGLFDWFAGNSTALAMTVTRWTAFAAFVVVVGFLLQRTVRCLFRRVSPYFVAHQLEQTIPDAKNSLINWLDMQDEEIPSAFQKTLSARAAEQLEESDTRQVVPQRKNWALLGLLGVPAMGLLVLLLLGPTSLAASLLRAFVPFYVPAPITRTQIALLEPAGGNAAVGAASAVVFSARIDGPAQSPRLLYRYQSSEDYLTQSLQLDPGGLWTTQLQPSQLRNGFTYKLAAGDAETPEHRVVVRARAHVRQYEIAYHHKPYRRLKTPITRFPNERETTPSIRGPRGSEVVLTIQPSRPVKKAIVEIISAGVKAELPMSKRGDDAYTCKWLLVQPGQFRVAFTTADGEENIDRDWRSIETQGDEPPTVVLTSPGKDIQMPENDTLILEGEAASAVGIKAMTLHLQVVAGPDKGFHKEMPYRALKSFQEDDGGFPGTLQYLDTVPLEHLKNAERKDYLGAGTVIEYWLEAVDCTDHVSGGQVGKSPVFKVTLVAMPSDPRPQQARREQSVKKQQAHAGKQDNDLAQQQKQRQNQANPGAQNPKQDLDRINQEKKDAEDKIKHALKNQQDGKDKGTSKSGDEQRADAKGGPPDGQEPQSKDGGPTAPEDSGQAKDEGGGKGSAGAPKDDGAAQKKSKSPGDATKGDRKDGPMELPSSTKGEGPMMGREPPGGTKDAGMKGTDAPIPIPPRDQAGDGGAPTPIAKGTPVEPQTQGHAKGVEENGPEMPAKGGVPTAPPQVADKGSAVNDGAGAAKQGMPEPGKAPGAARGDHGNGNAKEPNWDELARLINDLPRHDAQGDATGRALKEIADKSGDPRKRDLASEALEKNGRDPKTGKELKKGPNPYGSGGVSKGISDDVKAAAANREFAARIGQMQLDDWKRQMTPELLKKAGLTEAQWRRYLAQMQAHDLAVRQLNARLLQKSLQDLRAGNAGAGLRDIETTGSAIDPLVGRPQAPPELRDPLRRFRP